MTVNKNPLRSNIIRVSKIHFIFVAVLIAQIIIYDASKLVPPEDLLKRWMITALLLTVTTAVWYFAKNKSTSAIQNKILLLVLILADIALVSSSVYMQRGMSSRAVALYAIPILVSAILLKRSAVYAVALLCITAYTLTSVAYFVLNFNEGYKIELYGEIGFYSVTFLIIAGLVSTLLPKKSD